jgi:hypothetical protein
MIAYIDSLVLLRVAPGQANALKQWSSVERGVSSALISTESLRTLDRARLRASALLWKDATGVEPFMATHDTALGLAAQAHGLKVLGT